MGLKEEEEEYCKVEKEGLRKKKKWVSKISCFFFVVSRLFVFQVVMGGRGNKGWRIFGKAIVCFAVEVLYKEAKQKGKTIEVQFEVEISPKTY